MKAGGFYKSHSLVQKMVIEKSLPLIAEAAARVPLPDSGRPFTIVDYGCGEGKNSLIPVGAIIDNVGARQKGLDFLVIHNDLPSNNFNGLAQDIHADGEGSYLVGKGLERRIFALLAGCSFYGQVAPDASVHFAFSSSAFHWLTDIPEGSIADHVFHWGATAEEGKRIAEIGARDWLTLLARRARELAPGARMVITMAASEKVTAASGEPNSAHRITNLLNDVLLEMVKERRVDRRRYRQFAFPILMRTLAEVVAPMQGPDAPLAGAFSVEHATVHRMNCPFTEAYKQTGDRQGFADEIVASVRAFTEPMLIKGLLLEERQDRDGREARRLADEVYLRMRQRVLARPEAYPFNVVQLTAVLARR